MAMQAGKFVSILIIAIWLTTNNPATSAYLEGRDRLAGRDYESIMREASRLRSQAEPLQQTDPSSDRASEFLQVYERLEEILPAISPCDFFSRFYQLFCAKPLLKPAECRAVIYIITRLPGCIPPCKADQTECKPCHSCSATNTAQGLCAPGYVCCRK